jgi:predicted dehydrogenase
MTVVGHQLRFNPFVRLIRDEWVSGSLGDVYSIAIRQRGGAFASALRPWTWEFEKSRGGGVRLAMGTHLIDTVNFLSGCLPLSSHFFMDPVHRLRRPDGIGPDRFVDSSCFFSASLDYGRFGSLVSTSAASHGPGSFEIEVLGSTGTIYFDGVETLRIFRNGTLVDISLPSKLLRSYVDRPGASIFRKSLSMMAEQMANFINRRENHLGDASTVDQAIKILDVLDLGMDAFNARMSEKRNVF